MRTLVGAPIADQTMSVSRTRTVAVELEDVPRPSGARVFVRVRIDDDNEPASQSVDLEPEQARRLAQLLEHGADLADREPVKLVRVLVEQLAYYHGENPPRVLDDARRWLERHDAETGK